MPVVSYSRKICLLGDFAVGKTSLIRRFVSSSFSDQYITTIGVKVSKRTLASTNEPDPYTVTMLIWDTVGGEPFTQVARQYYVGSAGALLVCDLTRPDTLDALRSYASDFLLVNPRASLMVLANKADLAALRMIDERQVAELAAQYGAPWALTSAKTGEQVEEAFTNLVQQMHQRRRGV